MPQPRRVALLAPMRSELRPLLGALGLGRDAAGAGGPLRGACGRTAVVATTTGIGTRAAGEAAERVLDAAPVDHLVVVGIAGAVGERLAIGDLLVPERVLDLATGAVHRPAPLGPVAPRGTLATCDELLVDPNRLARLARDGVVAIDMETAAIAAVCERRGLPWSVFRAISDRAGDGGADADVLALAGPDGGGDLPALARFVLARPWRIPRLVRLGLGARRAAAVAARAAAAALRTPEGPVRAGPGEARGPRDARL